MSIFFTKLLFILCLCLIGGALVLLVCNIYSDWYSDGSSVKLETTGFIRQNGDYWVWHNYIMANEDFVGNESITLATHATYADLSLLPSSVSRWQAPISLAIFACGDDFDKLIDSLGYIESCLAMGHLLRRFVTIHLVFHQDHLPDTLRLFRWPVRGNPHQCQYRPVFENATQRQSYWHRNKLRYPVNLLRNVARLNVRTYYVLSLDIQLAPPPKFDQRFLKFVWQKDNMRHEDIHEPYTSVFCLPTFPHKVGTPLAETKSQLLEVLKESRSDNANEVKKWLAAVNPQEKLFIYKSSKKMDMCVAYVSINELEPLYDEANDDESIFEQGRNLKGQVLIDLNYTFMVLDGAFLLQRASEELKNPTPIHPKKVKYRKWRKWYMWHQFYTKVISLVPEELSQGWYSRSRTSLYFQAML